MNEMIIAIKQQQEGNLTEETRPQQRTYTRHLSELNPLQGAFNLRIQTNFWDKTVQSFQWRDDAAILIFVHLLHQYLY